MGTIPSTELPHFDTARDPQGNMIPGPYRFGCHRVDVIGSADNNRSVDHFTIARDSVMTAAFRVPGNTPMLQILSLLQ